MDLCYYTEAANAQAAQAMQRPQEKNTIALSTVPTIDVIRPIVAKICFSPAALASFLAPADNKGSNTQYHCNNLLILCSIHKDPPIIICAVNPHGPY